MKNKKCHKHLNVMNIKKHQHIKKKDTHVGLNLTSNSLKWGHPFLFYFLYFLFQPHFILSGLNYYVLAFKLIIWYSALIVYIHVFTLYLYLKIPACNYICNYFCNYIYNYTHPLHLNPPLNLPTPPNLSLTLPVSHINNSKSVLQYSMNTISTLYLFFDVST